MSFLRKSLTKSSSDLKWGELNVVKELIGIRTETSLEVMKEGFLRLLLIQTNRIEMVAVRIINGERNSF